MHERSRKGDSIPSPTHGAQLRPDTAQPISVWTSRQTTPSPSIRRVTSNFTDRLTPRIDQRLAKEVIKCCIVAMESMPRVQRSARSPAKLSATLSWEG